MGVLSRQITSFLERLFEPSTSTHFKNDDNHYRRLPYLLESLLRDVRLVSCSHFLNFLREMFLAT